MPEKEDIGYLTALAPGYRRGELLQLHREMLDLAELLIEFYLTQKQGRDHQIPARGGVDLDK